MFRYIKYQIIRQVCLFKSNYGKWSFAFIGSFLGILFISLFHSFILKFTSIDSVMLIGSFGASAVIVFGTPKSLYASPRHLIVGHIISALVGVLSYKLYGIIGCLWFCSAVAVSVSTLVMLITQTTHPPGGATALIAVMGSEKIHQLNYLYLMTPVLTGVLILLGTSFVLHWFIRQIRI